MRATRYWAVGTAIWIGLVWPAGVGAQRGPPATPVRVDEVRVEVVPQMRTVTGQIEARRRSIVASEESGKAIFVPFDAGDVVKKGAILAELDSTILHFELAEAEAMLEQEQAVVEERLAEFERDQREYESLKNLATRGAANPKEVDDARTELSRTEARLTTARHAASLADVQVSVIRERLARKTITAPFAGVVIIKHSEVGQWVTVGGPIVEIIEIDRVDAVLDVPEWIVNHITLGASIDVQLEAMEEPVTGTVRAIIPLGDERARTYPTKIALANSNRRLRPGMSLTAWIPIGGNAPVPTVHRDAVLRSPTGAYVYVVRGGVAVRVSVDVRQGAGPDRVVVNGSLESGEPLVVEGNERLHPGAPVNVTGDEPTR